MTNDRCAVEFVHVKLTENFALGVKARATPDLSIPEKLGKCSTMDSPSMTFIVGVKTTAILVGSPAIGWL